MPSKQMSPVKQTVTVIQARVQSTRLPKKIILPILGRPVLALMLERVRAAKLVGTVVVATTTDSTDDPIEALCQAEDIPCYRGHPTDLLDRHYQLAKQYQADVVVKIPSDVVLIDPQVIDRVLAFYLDQADEYDFVSNLHPQSYPDGNDVEVMSMGALEIVWREAKRDFEREHTTPFFWENPDRFRLGNVTWETGLNYSRIYRLVLDYAEDFELIKIIYEALYPQNSLFSLNHILNFLDHNPDVRAINAKYVGVNWYRHHLDQLKTVTEDETRTPIEEYIE